MRMAAAPSQGEQDAVDRFLAEPNADTYSVLFRCLVSQVTGYFRARGCRPPADEDLTQDVMIAVYRQSHQLREKSLFRPWLFRIARNALLQHRQREERRGAAVEWEQISAPATDPLAAAQFAQWIRVLTADEQEVILLRYVEGLQYREIASMLEIPLGTVQWRVFQSKKKLASRFGAP
jgi:RNA polymerase sigma-70 factor (ECF subfamily)